MKTTGFRILSCAPSAGRDLIMKTESNISLERSGVFLHTETNVTGVANPTLGDGDVERVAFGDISLMRHLTSFERAILIDALVSTSNYHSRLGT